MPGSGWYLPPFGDCKWPGAWARDVEAELEALGLDAAARKRCILGGSTAAWSADAASFDSAVWEGTMSVAERPCPGIRECAGGKRFSRESFAKLSTPSRMGVRGSHHTVTFTVGSDHAVGSVEYRPSMRRVSVVGPHCSGSRV